MHFKHGGHDFKNFWSHFQSPEHGFKLYKETNNPKV